MSRKTPPASVGSLTTEPLANEWVEIVEPKSKKRIYANLETGICAKSPPEGALVSRSEDFTDHWWELYDQKTGKYYYYNPEQQKTAWTKPQDNSPSKTGIGNGGSSHERKRLLIIPVSKLQTFKKLSSNDVSVPEKCDASTQTVASKLVSIGTQTATSESKGVDDELSSKFRQFGISSTPEDVCEQEDIVACINNVSPLSDKSNKSSNSATGNENNTNSVAKRRSYLNRRQMSDFNSRDRYMKSIQKQRHIELDETGMLREQQPGEKPMNQVSSIVLKLDRSSQSRNLVGPTQAHASQPSQVIKRLDQKMGTGAASFDASQCGSFTTYFGPSPAEATSSTVAAVLAANQKDNLPRLDGQHSPAEVVSSESEKRETKPNRISSLLNNHQHLSSTSTFGQPPRPPPPVRGKQQYQKAAANQNQTSESSTPAEQVERALQQVSTNNLSHYLVREAREMGIALISDDETGDEDLESDDECGLEEDDETDLRDDTSSRRLTGMMNVSQDLGEESSDGWKSFSDQESPFGTARTASRSSLANQTGPIRTATVSAANPTKQQQRAHFAGGPSVQKSPLYHDTKETFTYNNPVIDEEKDPTSCLSQQLDHQKLVDNFKKSRQTSSFGMHDSLGRAHKLDNSQTVQRIKAVADTYFQAADPTQVADLRHLSTLSTLPRPHRDKSTGAASRVALVDGVEAIVDADYDLVEESVSLYSDSRGLSRGPPTSNRMDTAGSGNVSSQALSSSKPVSQSALKSKTPDNHEPPSPIGHFDRNKSTRGSTFSVESFARENLTRHPKKGGLLFNRKVKWDRMIVWTKNSIKQPMISSVSSDLSSDSIQSFKLIQQFMGDRKLTMSKRYRQVLTASMTVQQQSLGGSAGGDSLLRHHKSLGRSVSISSATTSGLPGNKENGEASSGHPNSGGNPLPDRLRDELAYELVIIGCSKVALRDEIYVQMVRQLTENPNQDSVTWGLILLSILLSYFSPSNKFAPFLVSFLESHPHQMARDVCLPRLEKRLNQNWPTYCRKPTEGSEISIVRLSIAKWPQYCGIFGESLERIMALQQCSPYLRTLRLPWILTTLAEKLLETGGAETEGIFRCAADHDLLAQLRLEIDCVDFRKITDAKQVHSLFANVQDPHVIAGLLKLLFRQLKEPVFPVHLYEQCLESGHEPRAACQVFVDKLDNLNKDVVAYLIRLLQQLAAPDRVAQTKMDSSNLSMVWAPNLLRLPTNLLDSTAAAVALGRAGSFSGSKLSVVASGAAEDCESAPEVASPAVVSLAVSQSVIFERTRQEMQFIRALIGHLDTSFIESVI